MIYLLPLITTTKDREIPRAFTFHASVYPINNV